MLDAYIGQIQAYAGTYPPRDWAFCQGQTLAVNANPELYSVIGTTYGGDGRTSFKLPDLRGRVAVGASQTPGPGLTPRRAGQFGGQDEVTLVAAQLPPHTHVATASVAFSLSATPDKGTDVEPSAGDILAAGYHTGFDANLMNYTGSDGPTVELGGVSATLSSVQVAPSGANRAHTNIQPVTAINYVICISGLYPPRT